MPSAKSFFLPMDRWLKGKVKFTLFLPAFQFYFFAHTVSSCVTLKTEKPVQTMTSV